jgi:tail tube protein gp19
MKRQTRREFLKIGAGAALSGMGARTLLAGTLFGDPAPQNRAYTAGKYLLELDHAPAGWIASAEGGHATSAAANEAVQGPETVPNRTIGGMGPQKHLAGVKYEDITVICGTGMSRNFYEWIKSSFDRTSQRKDGAIQSCDYDLNASMTMEFSQALINGVGFPALDAASREEGSMTIRFAPETIRNSKGAGKCPAGPGRAAQKRWLPSNFRLQISGLNTSQVSRVEAIAMQQLMPGRLQYSSLAFALPEQHAGPLMEWQRAGTRRVPQGTIAGQLDFLSPDLRETLFTLTFSNLAMMKLEMDALRRVRAEMAIGDMRFNYSNAAWA